MNTFLLAISCAQLIRSRSLARRLLSSATRANGTDGYAASLQLWVAFNQQGDGNLTEAIETYKSLAGSPIAPIRRNALASGTFVATMTASLPDIHWFLHRMSDEDEDHQRRVFEIVTTLRTNRSGHRRVDALLHQVHLASENMSTASRWIRDTGIM